MPSRAPGSLAVHEPTGQQVTVNWETSGPGSTSSRPSHLKSGPWYWVRFHSPVEGLTETNGHGYHSATVHGSTLRETVVDHLARIHADAHRVVPSHG